MSALLSYLKPITPYLEQDGVTEVCINKPGELWFEKGGIFEHVLLPELNLVMLETLAELIAEFNAQSSSRQKPLLSGNLPCGARVEIVRAPACEKDKFVMSIRKPNLQNFSLGDYEEFGAFEGVKGDQQNVNSDDANLVELYQDQNYKNFIRQAIKSKKNIIVSGGTGTGKTTFLNACLQEVAESERLITVEDNREVKVQQPNCAHLIATRAGQGVSQVSVADLFESCLRLRPDRIFLSEIRGQEVFAFLEAINSGHPGSLTTIHADNCNAAFEQLYRKMRRFGDKSERAEIFAYLKSIIHVVVQLKRCPTPDRHMYISEVYFGECSDDF